MNILMFYGKLADGENRWTTQRYIM